MPHLKVIRASAGSGKTYSLTGEFLKLLFEDSDYFQHILAVTFTNKATAEMKDRIIRELNILSTGEHSKHLKGLITSTSLPEKIIRSKAAVILKKILHNYSRFSISTIDSFFQRVIRSFTRELGIQGNYNIELDTNLVLTEIIDRLFIQVEDDPSLLEWLTRFAESQIEQGKSWNFRENIIRLGSEIFKEAFKSLKDETINKFSDRQFLKNYQEDLHAITGKIEKEYRLIGENAVELIRKNNLTVEDFSNKWRGPAGFLAQVASGNFKEPNATAIEATSVIEKWFTKNAPLKNQIEHLCRNGLMDCMQNLVQYYDSHAVNYFTCVAILRNLYVLGIIADLSKLADAYCEENNIFLLPEASVFLNRIIEDSDTPFVYEKSGYWYHHFMIDEFQDTSIFQWKNFKPLISNSLSQDYDNLVVGDAKQSIYRWRNSNWEILSGGIEKDFIASSIEKINLEKNWRSGKLIVDFNNSFFQKASMVLQLSYDEVHSKAISSSDEDASNSITGIYSDLLQSPGLPENNTGFVQIEMMKNDQTELTVEEKINNRLIEIIRELQDTGYSLNDIAIITRKNKEAKQIADFLLDFAVKNPDPFYRFDVISDEALRMGSSPILNFLSGLLEYIIEPDNALNNYYLLAEYLNYFKTGGIENEYCLPALDLNISPDKNDREMPSIISDLSRISGSLSFFETIEYLIIRFKLNRFNGERVYLQAFQDMAIEFSRKNAPDIAKFLEYWENTGKEKSVATPSGQNAIRLLTIHKAKGLEFKTVILPYCNWELNTYQDTILWCSPKASPYNRLEMIPLNYTTDLGKSDFAADYFTEYKRQYIDNLNLLYVAFTRAKNGLFVFCKEGRENQVKTIADLIRTVLESKVNSAVENKEVVELYDFYNKTNGKFILGSLPVIIRDEKSTPPEETVEMDFPDMVVADNVKIAFQGKLYFDKEDDALKRPVSEGKIMHEIFRHIRIIDDISSAVEKEFLEGKINQEEKIRMIEHIRFLMNDLQVLSWFTGEWQVLTEAEIILPKTGTKRPDRVLVKDDKAIVIDFKFGKKTSKTHESQVKEYAGLLIQMGYRQAEAYLWYVTINRVIKV